MMYALLLIGTSLLSFCIGLAVMGALCANRNAEIEQAGYDKGFRMGFWCGKQSARTLTGWRDAEHDPMIRN